MTHLKSIINKTIDYLAIPAVVGHEQPFIDFLKHDFQPLDVKIKTYDGLIAIEGKNPSSHYISAHIDRHGLISLGDGEYFYAAQYIKEIKYGESNIGATEILKSAANNFVGEHVYAYDPETGTALTHGTISKHSPSRELGDGLFYIHNMRDMPLDTPIAYAQMPKADHHKLSGQIDNTLSVAVIHELFKNGYQGTALLTIEEEIGYSWLHISRYFENNAIETDRLLVLDTSPYGDADRKIIDDGTVVLRTRDKSELFNADYTNEIAKICEDLNIPYHIKDQFLRDRGHETHQLGSTELGKLIMNTDKRWSGTTLQCPTTDYHTSHETTSFKAINHYYKILDKILI